MSKRNARAKQSPSEPSPPATVEEMITGIVAKERARVVEHANKLVVMIETNLAMVRSALERDDLASLSRYVAPFDAELATRAELIHDFDRVIHRARAASSSR